MQKEFVEEEITLKGYTKAVRKLVSSYLQNAELSELESLDKEFQEEEITEVSRILQLFSLWFKSFSEQFAEKFLFMYTLPIC